MQAARGLLQAGNREAAAEAKTLLGGVWLNRGDRSKAVEQLVTAFSLVEERGPSPEKAYVLQELSRIAMMGSDFERAIELGSESVRLAEELGLDSVRSRNLNTIGVAKIQMGDRRGLDDLERAVAIAAAAHSHEEGPASANLTWETALLGDVRRAGELHEQSRSGARISLSLGGPLGRGVRDGGSVHPRGRGGPGALHGVTLSRHPRNDCVGAGQR